MSKSKLLTGSDLAKAQWERYKFLEKTHHRSFMEKARKCDEMFAGDNHWDKSIKESLLAQNRPALTVNMIFATIQALTGEQITNRSETSFRPKGAGATDELATILTKISRHIDDDNEYDYLETDVFEDGVITSRGFFDFRVEFNDNMQGEVKISKENPSNIIPDGDADSYNPKDWRDVIKTVWMSAENIENLYGDKAKNIVHRRYSPDESFGIDSISRQTFSRVSGFWGGFPSSIDTSLDSGDGSNAGLLLGGPELRTIPTVRVLERQYYLYTDVESFWFPETGDLRIIPNTWDRDRITEFRDYANQNIGRTEVVSERKKRIRWTVSADDQVLFDNWSPYKSFTIVPYFPHFRYGRTIGAIENIIDAQELLNKTLSQELHVVNTTANSGWIVQEDSMSSMDKDELEEMGAKSGIVIEYKKSFDKPEKIQPNQIPTGLDRLSEKGAGFIQEVSSVTKTVLGQDREDVAARAIESKQRRSSVNFSRVMDNLDRSRRLGASKKLELVQQFYTEERVFQIAGRSESRPEQETIVVNKEADEEEEIINDLTLGEYSAIITSVPARDSLEDSQFEEAVRLRELGIKIPDETLVEVSRLPNRAEIAKQLAAAKEDPLNEQKEKAEIDEIVAKAELRAAEVKKTLAEAEEKKFEAAKNLMILKDPEKNPDLVKIKGQLQLEQLDKSHQKTMREIETNFNLRSQVERNAQEIQILKTNTVMRQKGGNKDDK